MRYLTALTMILLIGLTAQAGELITYQGRLTGTGGDPVANGNYTLTFSLWSDSLTGTSYWNETHNMTPVTDGLFSVNLGKDGALDASYFESEPLFLQIMVGASEIINPRTRLTSAPTAIAAKKVAGDIETGDGSLNLKSSAGTLAFRMDAQERAGTNFLMYNISPGYAEQLQLDLGTNDYGGNINIYPTGEIQSTPAFTIGLEPSPFRYPYLSFFDPTGSFPFDPAIKMGVEPTPFIEMTEQSGGYGDRPFIRMGVEPSPWRQGYLAFQNPDIGPPPQLMVMGINDSSGEWGSEFDMYLVHPPEYPTPKQILSIGSAPSTGASFKMFNPQPEPPAVFFEISAMPNTGPLMNFHDEIGKVLGFEPMPFNEGFSINFIDPADDGKMLEIASNHNIDEASIKLIDPGDHGRTLVGMNSNTLGGSIYMFNPQPEPPAKLFDLSMSSNGGASMSFGNISGALMTAEPSPDGGFSIKMEDPEEEPIQMHLEMGNSFSLKKNNLMASDGGFVSLYSPTDYLESHLVPGGMTMQYVTDGIEGPAIQMEATSASAHIGLGNNMFNVTTGIIAKSTNDVVMKLTSTYGEYETKITPGRVKVGHSSIDDKPRGELNAGADSITFFIQGNSESVSAPAIAMLSSSTEAKLGIGTLTPSVPLVVGKDLGYFGGTRAVIGGDQAGTENGIVIGENNNYRGWMLWNVDNDFIGFGTKHGGATYGSTITMQTGLVGIGGLSTGAEFHVIGDICYTGSIGTCSDVRYKRDVRTLGNALERISRLRGVSFDWKRNEFPEYNFSSDEQVGLIAQEVKEVVPEVVSEDNNGYYNVDYTKLTPLLIEAIKELKIENEALKERLEKIESQL